LKDRRCISCHSVKQLEEYEQGERRCISCVKRIYSQIKTETKICSRCKIEKNKERFPLSKSTKSGLYLYCAECSKLAKRESNKRTQTQKTKKSQYFSNYKSKNPEIFKETNKRTKLAIFGLTVSEYEEILKTQNGLCAICKKKQNAEKSLAVDHNHKTGNVRGLLCSNCNTALGLFKDSIVNLESAIIYLKERN